MMNIEDWLIKQKQLYQNQTLPNQAPPLSPHPVSGQWQNSNYMKTKFWWSGGASQEACDQIELASNSNLTEIAVLTFGPVQTFLGGGQKLRDWAVASWLCHYLTAVLIYRWQQHGGKVLLPLHHSSEFLNWLEEKPVNAEKFWQAELPNVITGLHPNSPDWLSNFSNVLYQEWGKFIECLENVVINYSPKLLNGQGWRVIRSDNQYLWSVYAETKSFQIETVSKDIESLHQLIESRKVGRQWEGTWWGGRTSPSDGCLSIWHPGLRLVYQEGGTWGLPHHQIEEWWKRAAEESRLSGLFSSDDRLNSIELVKRLASVPEIIEPTLEQLWGKKPPACPWERFPDRTAVAAAWVPTTATAEKWNQGLEFLYEYFSKKPRDWGMPTVDRINLEREDLRQDVFFHPQVLERRNFEEPQIEDWQDSVPFGWENTIEWTVGWRGDGDNMGKWLSGEQYQKLNLLWCQWHPTPQMIAQYNLGINPLVFENNSKRQVELPHILDLSVLFGLWNRLLYPLTEKHHNGKVIFAGGDDFLLLGPLTEAISLTNDLYRLWRGDASPLTQPLNPPVDGWVQYEDEIYPVPGQKMDFSLGVVIAQRRIPQSLWHRGLNQAYKEAKNRGKNRVCVRILFNSGQSLDWVCPWPLWNLLMSIQPVNVNQTELNSWDKLLGYLESTRLQENSISTVQSLLETLWASVGIPLTWAEIIRISGREFLTEIESWSWWINWISLKAFLARQERERQKWLQLLAEGKQ